MADKNRGREVSNPVALPVLLAVTSVVVAGLRWHSASHKLPIWWNIHAHPIAWVPRWFGLLFLPFLELVIPYILYQFAANDPKLERQSGESAYAIANIIALPAVFLFAIFHLVYLEAAISTDHIFPFRIFSANVAIWLLVWLGYNLKYVEPNASIGLLPCWTTSSKDLWKKVHQRAAWLLISTGVVLFILALACPPGVAFLVVTLVVWLGGYVAVLLDSYMVSRDHAGSTVSEALREPLTPSPIP